MDSKRIYCLQFVVQNVIKTPEVEISGIQKIGLKFGDQVVHVQNKKLNFENNEIELKKGKICFCEEETLGFEVFVETPEGRRASTMVSFISFEDRRNRSVLNTVLDLKDTSKKTILNLSVLSSRHILENLGRPKDVVSTVTQTPVVFRKVNFSQTESREVRNSESQAKPETKTTSTQTLQNSENFKKELFKLVLFLVYRISLKLTSMRDQEEAVPEEPRVNLKDARQFSEFRKRQIEEMRERLRVMAEARREILEQSERKLMNKSETKTSLMDKSMDRSMDGLMDKSMDVRMTKLMEKSIDKSINKSMDGLMDKSMEKSTDKPVNKLVDESMTKFTTKLMNDPELNNVTFTVEDPKITVEPLSAPEIVPELIPEVVSSPKTSSRSKGSSVPSPLESDVFDDLEDLPEVESVTVNERRKSYTLSPEKEKHIHFGSTLNPSSAFLNPNFNFVNRPKTEKKENAPESVSTESDTSSEDSESGSTEVSESTSESTVTSEISKKSKKNEKLSTSEFTVTSESSSTSSESSRNRTRKEKISSTSESSEKESSSSILGEGSLDTVESIEEELPSPNSSSTFGTSSEVLKLKSSPKKPPESKKMIREIRRKSVHTDSVSSYAPSDL